MNRKPPRHDNKILFICLAVLICARNESAVIGDLIDSQVHSQNGNLPTAAALSLILMAVILVSTLILNRFSDDEEGGKMLV